MTKSWMNGEHVPSPITREEEEQEDCRGKVFVEQIDWF